VWIPDFFRHSDFVVRIYLRPIPALKQKESRHHLLSRASCVLKKLNLRA
jgi:hypothetical protein